MSNIFWKSFHLCFTKMESKDQPSILPTSPSKQDDTISSSASTSTDTDDSESDADLPPADFATIFASQRFFVSSPGRSNSIIESHSTRRESGSVTTKEAEVPPLDGGVAIKKYSPDPYKDFRFSMQEMIEARNLTHDVKKKDWEFLHELLLSYLTLNPKNTHKFIITAFADIVVCLLSSSSSSPPGI